MWTDFNRRFPKGQGTAVDPFRLQRFLAPYVFALPFGPVEFIGLADLGRQIACGIAAIFVDVRILSGFSRWAYASLHRGRLG